MCLFAVNLFIFMLIQLVMAAIPNKPLLYYKDPYSQSINQNGCVVLFTGWFHRCIRLASECSRLMHRWNQPVNKTTYPFFIERRWQTQWRYVEQQCKYRHGRPKIIPSRCAVARWGYKKICVKEKNTLAQAELLWSLVGCKRFSGDHLTELQTVKYAIR